MYWYCFTHEEWILTRTGLDLHPGRECEIVAFNVGLERFSYGAL
jgi:hypothetical protein